MQVPSNINFLVVDDFFTIRKMIKSNLKQLGFNGLVLEADSTATAINILQQQQTTDQPINMILSDWEMPGGTGLDFLKFVRGDERFKSLPFIMITTVNEKDKVLAAIKGGASNYLTKPWSVEDFAAKIVAVWQKHNPPKE